MKLTQKGTPFRLILGLEYTKVLMGCVGVATCSACNWVWMHT